MRRFPGCAGAEGGLTGKGCISSGGSFNRENKIHTRAMCSAFKPDVLPLCCCAVKLEFFLLEVWVSGSCVRLLLDSELFWDIPAPPAPAVGSAAPCESVSLTLVERVSSSTYPCIGLRTNNIRRKDKRGFNVCERNNKAKASRLANENLQYLPRFGECTHIKVPSRRFCLLSLCCLTTACSGRDRNCRRCYCALVHRERVHREH